MGGTVPLGAGTRAFCAAAYVRYGNDTMAAGHAASVPRDRRVHVEVCVATVEERAREHQLQCERWRWRWRWRWRLRVAAIHFEHAERQVCAVAPPRRDGPLYLRRRVDHTCVSTTRRGGQAAPHDDHVLTTTTRTQNKPAVCCGEGSASGGRTLTRIAGMLSPSASRARRSRTPAASSSCAAPPSSAAAVEAGAAALIRDSGCLTPGDCRAALSNFEVQSSASRRRLTA